MSLKQLYKITLTVLCVLVAVSCRSKDEPTPPPTDLTHRTVLVYMAADNSLGRPSTDENGNRLMPNDSADMAEMLVAAHAGHLQGGRVLVYHCGVSDGPVLAELTPQGFKELRDYSKDGLSSIRAERMETVIADMKKLAPAKEYGLVLWSHGDGWLQNGFDEEASTYAWGSENGRKMNITTLASVLENKGFEWIYFDCCYMACVEVAYELRNSVKRIAGSVTELPAAGMPYQENLREFLRPEGADLVMAARNTFNHYDALEGDDRTCTMSVIKTDALNDLATATRRIYDAAERSVPAGYSPQPFMTEWRCWHFDLADYVSALAEASGDTHALQRWKDALARCVEYSAATPYIWDTVALTRHCGLSTFIFRNSGDETLRNYNTLSWFHDVAKPLASKIQ